MGMLACYFSLSDDVMNEIVKLNDEAYGRKTRGH